jgi:hypothetical protein
METEATRVFPEIQGVPLKLIHERCKGCKEIIKFDGFEGDYCSVYPNPKVFWTRGGCPLSADVADATDNDQIKKRVGQQKQKKKTRKK